MWSLRTIFSVLVVNGGLFFHSTCTLLVQILSSWLYFFPRSVYLRYIALTMRMWSQGLVATVQYFAPSRLVFTLDSSILENNGAEQHHGFLRNDQNMITGLSFPKRIIVMSNHQTYADWLYIWCVAYLSKAHGDIKIILKDSLKGLPVYGMVIGMQYFDFIFIKRKLALDKEVIEDNLVQTKVHQQPMWLVLFPEGTVISENTRQSSAKYAKANDLKTNAHTLLPRSTGLRLCTESLGDSVEWLYDFTIGYSGLSSTDIPEDVYSIPKIFFFQKYPEKIHLHLRRFATKDIPQAPEAYATWLQQRWAEKDDLLAYFYKHQHFPTEKTDTHEFPVALRNPWFELILVYLFTLPYIPFTYVAWPTLSTYAKKYTG